MIGRALTCLLAAAMLTAGTSPVEPTLRDAIRQFGVDAAGLPDTSLGRRLIGSTAVTAGSVRAIAYFDDPGDGLIHSPLYVAMRDGAGPWREAKVSRMGTFDPKFGSATAIHLSPSMLLIDTQDGPSSSLIVLRRKDLTLAATLTGAFVTALPSELIVYARSSDQASPAGADALSTFDLKTTRDRRLYPGNASSVLRQAFAARLRQLSGASTKPGATSAKSHTQAYTVAIARDGVVFDAAADTLKFSVTLSADTPGRPGTPLLSQRVRVTCRPMKAAAPACTETSAPQR